MEALTCQRSSVGRAAGTKAHREADHPAWHRFKSGRWPRDDPDPLKGSPNFFAECLLSRYDHTPGEGGHWPGTMKRRHPEVGRPQQSAAHPLLQATKRGRTAAFHQRPGSARIRGN